MASHKRDPSLVLVKMRGSLARDGSLPAQIPHQPEATKMSTTGNVLAGQVAVVTGAGRGIGAAIAATLSQLGASVVVSGRTPAHLEQTVGSISQAGNQAESVPCDVTSAHSVQN